MLQKGQRVGRHAGPLQRRRAPPDGRVVPRRPHIFERYAQGHRHLLPVRLEHPGPRIFHGRGPQGRDRGGGKEGAQRRVPVAKIGVARIQGQTAVRAFPADGRPAFAPRTASISPVGRVPRGPQARRPHEVVRLRSLVARPAPASVRDNIGAGGGGAMDGGEVEGTRGVRDESAVGTPRRRGDAQGGGEEGTAAGGGDRCIPRGRQTPAPRFSTRVLLRVSSRLGGGDRRRRVREDAAMWSVEHGIHFF
mmetsp:Transcript_43248/g.101396  ORF Transcript_43248/g.101396 Transcript_43248/m.101396 type:complete len:249 (+) Transcript_43248:603-1349(+)